MAIPQATATPIDAVTECVSRIAGVRLFSVKSASTPFKEPFIATPLRIREILFSLHPYDAQVYLYLERHLIGWQNDELAISADEVLHGRRKATGGRYDNGLPLIKSKTRVLQ